MSKFSDRIAERFYQLSLDGAHDEETGSVQELGWSAIFRMRRASVILTEDSQGFIDSSVLSHDEAEEEFAILQNADSDIDQDIDTEDGVKLAVGIAPSSGIAKLDAVIAELKTLVD